MCTMECAHIGFHIASVENEWSFLYALILCEVRKHTKFRYVMQDICPNNMFRMCKQHTPSDNTFGGVQRKQGPTPGRKRGI